MLTPAEDFLARQVRETALFTDFTTFIDRIRGERPSPRLQDVDLMSEYVLARNMYIFDVLPGDPAFKIRFVGSAICNFFGFDPTGRFLEGLDFVESFDATIAGYHTIVREREPHAFLNHIASISKERTFASPEFKPTDSNTGSRTRLRPNKVK